MIGNIFDDKLKSIVLEVEELKKENVALTTKVSKLEDELTAANRKIDGLESYNRRDNLIVTGLPLKTAAEAVSTTAVSGNRSQVSEHSLVTEETVLRLFNTKLNVPVTTSDISIAHRLKISGNARGPPAVIVRFSNRKARDSVYAARRSLKNIRETPIFINEDLTKQKMELFAQARRLAKAKALHSTWTSAGDVFYKISSDPTSRPVRVQSSSDLPVLPRSN